MDESEPATRHPASRAGTDAPRRLSRLGGERSEDEEDDDDGNGNGTSEAGDGDASEDDDDDAALLEALVGIALVIGMLLPPGFITGKLNW